MLQERVLGFIWRVLNREGRERIYVKDLSGDCEDLGLRRFQDRNKETSQEATAGYRHKYSWGGNQWWRERGGWIPGVLWVWEVRKGEKSRMTLWALGGWMVLFSQSENPGEEQRCTGNSRAPF